MTNFCLLQQDIHLKYTPFLKACRNKANAICMVGINKSFNMAGLSCSNAVVQDPELYKQITKDYPMTMPTPFAIAGQIAAYTEGDEWMDQVCEYIEGNIDWVIDFFKKEIPKVKIAKPEGTYCLPADRHGISGCPVMPFPLFFPLTDALLLRIMKSKSPPIRRL